MSLPSLEPGPPCDYCGAPCPVEGYCDSCADRLFAEQRIQSGNDYRRQAHIRLDLASVRQRVRRYLRGGK